MSKQLRILMLAPYFPKPGNPRMGTWALEQAQALARRMTVEVVSPTSYLPAWTARLRPTLAAWTDCPVCTRWGNLVVHYPRWLFYHGGPFNRLVEGHPTGFLQIAWASVREAVLRVVDRLQPNLVYAHHAVPGGLVARRLHDVTGLPYVWTEHSVPGVELCRTSRSRRGVYRQVIEHAAATVSVSSVMVPGLRALAPSGRIEVIHNGAALPEATPGEPEVSLPDDATVVLSAGHFIKRKGMPLLAEAFLSIADAHPDAVLVMAGRGPEVERVRSIIEGHPLGGRVHLVGELDHPQLMCLMHRADVFALPSWHEAFGVVYAEAMLRGTPVVCCSDSGFAEVMTDRRHGRIVAPRDVQATAAALTELLGDPDARRLMARAACEHAEKTLPWHVHARTMERLFIDVIRTHGRATT